MMFFYRKKEHPPDSSLFMLSGPLSCGRVLLTVWHLSIVIHQFSFIPKYRAVLKWGWHVWAFEIRVNFAFCHEVFVETNIFEGQLGCMLAILQEDKL